MYVESYFQTAAYLYEQYDLQKPLPIFLKEYFKQNKKFGSRDRKFIAELLYGIYRLGRMDANLSVKERMLIGAFLSKRLPILFFEKTNANMASLYDSSFIARRKWIEENYRILFTMPYACSDGISMDEYLQNLFSQPRFFIRIRKNKESIIRKLKEKEITYIEESDTCLSFDMDTKLTDLFPVGDIVIQDWSSQKTGDFWHPISAEKWWDCCAASGGKSISLLDKNSKIDLTVSDIRPAILNNLHARMQQYAYGDKYVSHVLDLTKDILAFTNKKFDHIICDVPCSGSGTWARSPEQYYFFNEELLSNFQTKQYTIAKNALSYLKPNGYMFYITCSVFAAENENIIDRLKSENLVDIVSAQLINGIESKADCLFVAVLKKSITASS